MNSNNDDTSINKHVYIWLRNSTHPKYTHSILYWINLLLLRHLKFGCVCYESTLRLAILLPEGGEGAREQKGKHAYGSIEA